MNMALKILHSSSRKKGNETVTRYEHGNEADIVQFEYGKFPIDYAVNFAGLTLSALYTCKTYRCIIIKGRELRFLKNGVMLRMDRYIDPGHNCHIRTDDLHVTKYSSK